MLENGQYAGAYYIAGYAVECALKACIARQVQQYDFPDRDLAQKSYTHRLADLIAVAQLDGLLAAQVRAFPGFASNWKIVKDWNEASRYDPGISEKSARDLYSAITDVTIGVLPWLRTIW